MTNDQLASRIYENGKQIAASVTIQRRAADISLAWDGFVGLPGFVQCIRSADRPSRLTLVLSASSDEPESQVASFEAEILRSEPERMVAWRSATDAPIVHAGSVTLRELPFARGTELRVVIDYIPPDGAMRRTLDKALRNDPRGFLQLALFRFRQLLETGEVATTKGQPVGDGAGLSEGSQDEQAYAATEVKP